MKIRIIMKKEMGKGHGQSTVAYVENASGKFGEPTIILTTTVFRYWKRHIAYGWNHVVRTLLHELAHIQASQANPNKFIHHGKEWQERAIVLGASRYWLGKPMTERKYKRRRH